jgi:hypothetical protein
MAFLVEQDAGAVVGAHYHQADQFQVIVAGSGRVGHHDVATGAVHFAGAWSAYGPLAAGREGLQYFTLRNGWDPGARYMEFAENRSALRERPRRHREAVGAVATAADGLCVEQLQLTSGQPVTGIDPACGAGQFWLVLSGSLTADDAALPANSLVFVPPDGLPFKAVAARMELHRCSCSSPARPDRCIASQASRCGQGCFRPIPPPLRARHRRCASGSA